MFKKILIGILLIVLGFALGWITQFKRYEAKEWDLFIARELSQAQFCAIGLKLLNEQALDRLEDEFWHRIEQSLDRAERSTKYGATIQVPGRSIILRRVSDQAKLAGHDKLVAQSEAIKNNLNSLD